MSNIICIFNITYMLQRIGASPTAGAGQATELVALPWLHMIAVGAGGSRATENTEL